MNPSTIERWRAYLLVASFAAAVIQVAAIFAILVLRVPQDDFASPLFRMSVIALVACSVAVVRQLAQLAFRDALASRHVRLVGGRQRAVALSAHCPRKILVILHVRFNRQTLDPALY
jgi:4-amino-4-deoxy-L-arabinose transferase-like glycosyltransferase